MMLTVHGVPKATAPVLIVLGWLAFFGGMVAAGNHPVLSASLLTIARVLP